MGRQQEGGDRRQCGYCSVLRVPKKGSVDVPCRVVGVAGGGHKDCRRLSMQVSTTFIACIVSSVLCEALRFRAQSTIVRYHSDIAASSQVQRMTNGVQCSTICADDSPWRSIPGL